MTEITNARLVYGVSRWTNSYRPAARHINRGDGYPLCGGRKGTRQAWVVDEPEIGTPSCARCISMYKKWSAKEILEREG